MKKILFLLLAMAALTAQAQLMVVDNFIHTHYKRNYKVLSIDTVAMPIRILMSLDYVITCDNNEVIKEMNEIPELSLTEMSKRLQDLIINLEEKASVHAAAIERISEMEQSNTPDNEDYYNYQRVKVVFPQTGYEETFYTHIGDHSVSKTQRAYEKMKRDIFKAAESFKATLEQIRELHEKAKKSLD